MATGTAVCFYGQSRQYFRYELGFSNGVAAETRRLEGAAAAAIAVLRDYSAARHGQAAAEIFDAQRMLIEDSDLIARACDTVRQQKMNAEWALKIESDRNIEKICAISDPHLREKALDLRDAVERVQNFLSGTESGTVLAPNSVIVASEIRPSTLISFLQTPPVAIVTEHGGWTSHAFIIAREMQIPAVAGVADVLRRVTDGAILMVDAEAGRVTRKDALPSRSTAGFTPKPLIPRVVTTTPEPADLTTLDGIRISISANAETPERCAQAIKLGADGIGLLRSEYLFDWHSGVPDLETQKSTYGESFGASDGLPCRIRTFDIPADRLIDTVERREKNPALGLHGIRHSLADEHQFRIQLSAIVTAAEDADVEIVFPLVSNVDEVRQAKRILSVACVDAGRPIPRVGALIEVPAAVLAIESLLDELDFVCVGSNDLVQYLVAADRDNELVADTYQTLHPAVIRSLKLIADAAAAAGKTAVVCGEMAGSPFYIPLLLGLDFTSFSMNVYSIESVRELVRSISVDESTVMTRQILEVHTASEAETLLAAFHREHFPPRTSAESARRQ